MNPAGWSFPEHILPPARALLVSSGSWGEKGRDTVWVKAEGYLGSYTLSELTEKAVPVAFLCSPLQPHSVECSLPASNQLHQVSPVTINLVNCVGIPIVIIMHPTFQGFKTRLQLPEVGNNREGYCPSQSFRPSLAQVTWLCMVIQRN